LFVKKEGKYSDFRETTGTPSVSSTSRDLGMSKIDFMPADTTATGVLDNSCKSAVIYVQKCIFRILEM
jgi:hypothetical protein